MTQYDIVVAGAGPGGLGACLKAATLGLRVALIERRNRVSPLKRACSEGLLYEEEYYGDAVYVNKDKGTLEFEKNDFSLKYTGAVREVSYFANVSHRGNRMKIIRDDHKAIHLVFDKGRYLEENLEGAINAGVTFFPNQTVIDLETLPESVTVHTNKESFQARFFIVADGLNSLCAHIAGFNRDREFYGTMSNACWHIKGFEPEEPAHIHMIEGKGGLAVICLCPRFEEGEYNILIGGYSPNPSYREKFEQVQTRSVLSKYFNKNIQIMRRLACVLNLFSPLTHPCRDNMFIIGDAAWMGQTSNTHAALTGLKAVEYIYEALQQKKNGQDVYQPYQEWWNEHFARHIRPPGGNILEELTRDEIDEFFSYMPEEIEGSMEPMKAKKLMGAFFQNFLPKVQKKNPQLVQKIVSIQQKKPDEVWAEKRSMGFAIREKSLKKQ